MSKKNTNVITYTRFVYSIIDFFVQENQLPFDVSSYVKNESDTECKFARSKISKYIQRNRKKASNNRFFLTISFNANGTIADGRKILRSITENLLDKFLGSSCIETLYRIDPSASIEVFSSREISSMTDYIIILFNVSNNSSIECIISADCITSKLIEKDEEGDVVEYNSRLNRNLRSFKANLK